MRSTPRPRAAQPWARARFDRPVLEVAPLLLGAVIWHGPVGVRLTEVEAYAGLDDPGSHAFRGPTPRTTVMFGPPGHAYVYFSYGMHHCLNLVCEADGTAGAVLLRAGEVIEGESQARARRDAGRTLGHPARDLARGPARLTQTLGVHLGHDRADLCAPGAELYLQPGPPPEPTQIRTGPRVGVSGPGGDGTAYPWRFWVEDERSVSTYRPGQIVPARRG